MSAQAAGYHVTRRCNIISALPGDDRYNPITVACAALCVVLLQLFAANGTSTSRAMTKRRQAAQRRWNQSLKGWQFIAEVILWAVRWYVAYPISFASLKK